MLGPRTPSASLSSTEPAPFGRTGVANHGIADGPGGEPGVEGFVRTHNSMHDLNYRVMCILREEGVLGFPIQPSGWITQSAHGIQRFETRVVEGLLDLDPRIVPILYGHRDLDDAREATVVSGNAIVAWLARSLSADVVPMGMDVPGVCTADPKASGDARLIEEITSETFEEVRASVRGAATVDVTGGMERKLLEIRESHAAVPVRIFDATEPGRVGAALRGDRVGTLLAL